MKQYKSKAALIEAKADSMVQAITEGDWSDVKDPDRLVATEKTAAERQVRQFDLYSRPQGIKAQLGYIIEGFGWVKLA